ncbi:MAG TPA: peptidyl-prolyl cis-trans isomerase [Thermoanaerobaculia bacterium]
MQREKSPERTATALAAGLLTLLPLLAAPTLSADVVNQVVLRVNDRIATLVDYQRRREDSVREIMRREQDPKEQRRQLADLGEYVFKDMYEELLLASRADQLAIEVTDQEVDKAVASTRQNMGLKTDQDFQGALAQAGLTEAQLREQLRSSMRVREVMSKEVQGRVKVSEEDERRYYRKHQEDFRKPEQLEIREVIVLEDGGAPAAERPKIAAEIRQAVGAGKPMNEVVAEYVGKGFVSNMNDNWVSKGDLDPSLETVAWKLQPPQISEPIQGRGGLHLIQVVDHRPSRIQPFSEVQEQIKGREQDRVFKVETTKYMAELAQKSLIVANPPADAANFRRLLGAEKPEGPANSLPAAAAAAAADTAKSAADAANSAAPEKPATDGKPAPDATKQAPRPGNDSSNPPPAMSGNPVSRPGTLPEPKPNPSKPPGR